MLIDSLPVLQTQALRDLPARGGQAAAALHETTDKSQHFQLLGSEIGHGGAIPDGCLVSSLGAFLARCNYRSKSYIDAPAPLNGAEVSELDVIRAESGAPVR